MNTNQARALAHLQTPRESVRRLVRGFGVWALVVAMAYTVLAAFSLMRVDQRYDVYAPEDARDTARVLACSQYGPISLSGIGFYWMCEVEVDTDWSARYGFKADMVITTRLSEFTPDDIGHYIPADYYRYDVERYRYGDPGPASIALVVGAVAIAATTVFWLIARKQYLWATFSLGVVVSRHSPTAMQVINRYLRDRRLIAVPWRPPPEDADRVSIVDSVDGVFRSGERRSPNRTARELVADSPEGSIIVSGAGLTCLHSSRDRRHSQVVWAVPWRGLRRVEVVELRSDGSSAPIDLRLIDVDTDRQDIPSRYRHAMGSTTGYRLLAIPSERAAVILLDYAARHLNTMEGPRQRR
ncbi:DUF6346 domain-containing protein [Amycolatopsis suaedae]|uniref:Uncharacterized protein n=1 Tax=Amycolatopsis suaedae TaxID=2510978 RepID=A0A4V2EM92_9PSEU|nr:DUF6346 domain-containing protein [Amycolatopsis suaedae]RZQ64255.1 hypothetical protein EWH70_09750 [Amycolatopsis suaedae]